MADEQLKKKPDSIFNRMHLRHRVGISIAAALIAFLLLSRSHLDRLIISMIIWNSFALFFILTSWIVFFTRSTKQMRHRARLEDGSRVFVFTLVIISSFACMFAVLLLILSKEETTPGIIYVPVAIISMIFSWIVVHTTFCFHYTHLYYSDNPENSQTHAGGFDFPNENRPDFLDFAYFSFIIGMTFQVSDVSITSRRLRRLTLLHSLLSFCLNTFVVALVVNLIAGLKH